MTIPEFSLTTFFGSFSFLRGFAVVVFFGSSAIVAVDDSSSCG